MNEQLDFLSRQADTYAAELEASSWNVNLRVKCADDLPEELNPMNFEEYGYTKADAFPEETRGHKFIALYIAPEREDARLKERMDALDALLAEQPCFTLKDLAVNGNDLVAAGLKGKEVGETLQRLLEEVMDGRTENTREALLASLASDPEHH